MTKSREQDRAELTDNKLLTKYLTQGAVFVQKTAALGFCLAATYSISESKVVSMLFRMRNNLKRYFEKEGINL